MNAAMIQLFPETINYGQSLSNSYFLQLSSSFICYIFVGF